MLEQGIDDHHIFPANFLEMKKGVSLARHRDCILNRTLIDRTTNQMITDRAPSDYMLEILHTPGFPFDKVLESHCLPTGPDAPFWNDDYECFLALRQQKLWSEIQRATGVLEATDLEAGSSSTTTDGTVEVKAADEDSGHPPRFDFRPRYWSAFRERLAAAGSPLQPPDPPATAQCFFSPFQTGVTPWAYVSLKHKSVSVGVTFSGQRGLPFHARFRDQAETLSKELGGEISWEGEAGRGWVNFGLENPETDPKDEASWPRQHAWLHERLEAIHRIVPPMLRTQT
jgi:hypothetical protein